MLHEKFVEAYGGNCYRYVKTYTFCFPSSDEDAMSNAIKTRNSLSYKVCQFPF